MQDNDTIKSLFDCDTVYTYFVGITQRDHPSGNQNPGDGRNEDPVRAYVVEEAKKLKNTQVVFYNEKTTVLSQRNIVLRRSGSGAYESKAPIMLQAHMDMVCNPDDMAFPLELYLTQQEGESWLQAKEKGGRSSTLGADDGIGVATALALLLDQDLEAYPIECLFTLQEETDMGGAQGFDISSITGNLLLNLDSENLKEIIYGSAGGCDTKYTCSSLNSCTPKNQSWIQLSIQGLKGGHSGIEIGKNRLNAIKCLAQFLFENIQAYQPYLYTFDRLDSKTDNSIPAEAKAVIAVAPEKSHEFIEAFQTYAATLRDEGKALTTQQYTATPLASAQWETLDRAATNNFISILNALPAGALVREGNLVITSTNLFQASLIKQDNGWRAEIGSSNRSSDESSYNALIDLLIATGQKYGYTVDPKIDSYPMWQPDDNSQLLSISKNVYKKMYGDAYKANVIHAGLECAVFVKKYLEASKKLQAVAIGPTIANPHTPNESLMLRSVDGKHPVREFYECVKEIIKEAMAVQ